MKIAIEMSYTITSYATVDLPSGKSWDDVEEYYAKWGMLHVRFKGSEDWHEYDGGDTSTDSIDFKYPASVNVFKTDKEGNADYDSCLVRGVT